MARSDPIRVYFVFLPHPVKMNTYGDSLINDKISINLTPDFLICWKHTWVVLQHIIINIIPAKGPILIMIILEKENLGPSFVNNFTASEIGWEIPQIISLLGPFR